MTGTKATSFPKAVSAFRMFGMCSLYVCANSIRVFTYLSCIDRAINRDPELWGMDADCFRPERHIGPDGNLAASPADTKDEGHVTFGFGRR